jgi:thioredoxin reductase (NADPH)
VVLAAPGMEWRRLDLDGVDELLGPGVYYGAGRSEAAQCAGQSVVIVGAGNSAGQAVLNFANATARVTMLVRGDRLEQDDVRLSDRADRAAPADRRPSGDAADRAAHDATASSRRDVRRSPRQVRDARVDGVFLCIGGRPHTDWCSARARPHRFRRLHPDRQDLLANGTPPDCWPLERDPLPLETSRVGLFAAGDVRTARPSASPPRSGKDRWSPSLIFSRLAELGVTY